MKPHEVAAIRSRLPLRVQNLEITEPVVTFCGRDWSLNIMCPWRITAPHMQSSWESLTLEDDVWELVGRDLHSVNAGTGQGEMVIHFSGSVELIASPDTDLDPWTLSAPGVVVTGRMTT